MITSNTTQRSKIVVILTQTDFLVSYGLAFSLFFSSGLTTSQGLGSGSGPVVFLTWPGISRGWRGLGWGGRSRTIYRSTLGKRQEVRRNSRTSGGMVRERKILNYFFIK